MDWHLPEYNPKLWPFLPAVVKSLASLIISASNSVYALVNRHLVLCLFSSPVLAVLFLPLPFFSFFIFFLGLSSYWSFSCSWRLGRACGSGEARLQFAQYQAPAPSMHLDSRLMLGNKCMIRNVFQANASCIFYHSHPIGVENALLAICAGNTDMIFRGPMESSIKSLTRRYLAVVMSSTSFTMPVNSEKYKCYGQDHYYYLLRLLLFPLRLGYLTQTAHSFRPRLPKPRWLK
ncbi:hypothetical protein V8C35DRAFT_296104 [Trichoderma chlorosporum]